MTVIRQALSRPQKPGLRSSGCLRRRHPLTIGQTALLAGVLTWLRVGGDGAVILPIAALPARAFVGCFDGPAIDREQVMLLLVQHPLASGGLASSRYRDIGEVP